MPRCRMCGKEMAGSGTLCVKCDESQNPMPVDENGIPEGVKGWSWGAFLLGWIWAIGNRTWIGLLALVPFFGLVMNIVLGLKGREWAWGNRRWESVEQFNRVQRRWSVWGVALVGGFMAVGIAAAVALPAYLQHARQTQFAAVVATLSEGKPLLVEYLENGGSVPMDEATLSRIRSLAKASPAITHMDAYALDRYADIAATVRLHGQEGTVYLVSTDGGNAWSCRTTLAPMASAQCELTDRLDRPEASATFNRWERPFAQQMISGCIAQGSQSAAIPPAEYCTCVVEMVSRSVPQEQASDLNSPAFAREMDVATVACATRETASATN